MELMKRHHLDDLLFESGIYDETAAWRQYSIADQQEKNAFIKKSVFLYRIHREYILYKKKDLWPEKCKNMGVSAATAARCLKVGTAFNYFYPLLANSAGLNLNQGSLLKIAEHSEYLYDDGGQLYFADVPLTDLPNDIHQIESIIDSTTSRNLAELAEERKKRAELETQVRKLEGMIENIKQGRFDGVEFDQITIDGTRAIKSIGALKLTVKDYFDLYPGNEKAAAQVKEICTQLSNDIAETLGLLI